MSPKRRRRSRISAETRHDSSGNAGEDPFFRNGTFGGRALLKLGPPLHTEIPANWSRLQFKPRPRSRFRNYDVKFGSLTFSRIYISRRINRGIFLFVKMHALFVLPHISRILRPAHNLWTSEFREGNSAGEIQAGEREKWEGTKKLKECESAILILLCFADAGTNFAKLPTNRSVSGASCPVLRCAASGVRAAAQNRAGRTRSRVVGRRGNKGNKAVRWRGRGC